MMRRSSTLAFAAAIVVAATWISGCRSTTPGSSGGPWDVPRAEILVWHPDDEHFTQDRALETSGLAFTDDAMVAPSEKYARLLFFDRGLEARVVDLSLIHI